MVVAMTVTPALSVLLLGTRGGAVAESPIAVWLRERYDGMLAGVVKAPSKLFIGTAAVVVIGIALWPLLGQSLLPALKEPGLVVNWNTVPGTSHTETYRITSRAASELRAIPGVRNVAAHVGRAVSGDQVVGINSSQIWVSIDPQADYDKTVAAVRDTVDGYPGIDRSVQTYLRDKISEVLTGAATAIVVRLYGPKPEILRAKAEEVRQALTGIPGIADLRAEGQIEEPQVQVTVNLDAAGKAAVKPGDIRRSSATVFSGLTVGFLYENQKINDVVVWGAPETRHSLTNLHELSVGKSDRHHVRLGDVAEVKVVATPTVIRHEGIAPYIDVVANVAGRDLGSVAKDVQARLEKIQFPLEHNPKLLGEYIERLETERHITGITLAVVIGIFLLLQACLRSWRLALIVFLALPASIAGGVLAALVGGGTISLGSIVGFLAVLGIAARNGLLMVRHFEHLEERDGVPFGLDLVLRGARERLTPIAASAFATIGALLPIVVLGQVAGLEIAQPTAIVIIGGLIASTLFTLFVIPALYLIAGAGARQTSDLGLANA